MTKHATSHPSLFSGEMEKQQLNLQRQHSKGAQLQAALAPTAHTSKGLRYPLGFMQRKGSNPSEPQGCKSNTGFPLETFLLMRDSPATGTINSVWKGKAPMEEKDGEMGLRGEKSERRKGNCGGKKLFS